MKTKRSTKKPKRRFHRCFPFQSFFLLNFRAGGVFFPFGPRARVGQRKCRRGHCSCEMGASKGKAPVATSDPVEFFQKELAGGATAFLSKSDARAAAARAAVTALFGKLSSCVAAEGIDLPLPTLHTEGLDAEQVWMQIEMQLEPLLQKAKKELRRLKPVLSLGESLPAERLLLLPANGAAEPSDGGSESDEHPEWEPFQEGVEYDMDDEDDEEEEEEDEEDEGGDANPEKPKRKDLTKKLFKDPGMFNLAEMEDFAVQAEAEETERLAKQTRRAERAAGGGASGGDGSDDEESESDDDALDAEDDDADDSDQADDDSSSDDDDDMANLIGDAAQMAGVDVPSGSRASRKNDKAAAKKKGKDIMFTDFFGDAPSGKGPRKKAKNEDEMSDEEEDLFGEMERGEMEGGADDDGEQGSSDSDEGVDALDQEDEDALRAELERELANELAEGSDEEPDEDEDGGEFKQDDDDDDDAEKDGSEEEDDEEEDDERDDEHVAATTVASRRDGYAPSAFQRAQTKLAKQISGLEKRALETKTWLLKGEASAKERPKNSVLEADLEFDHNAAAPPVVSEEMTQKLEDVIKSRIVEQRFDDVERVEPSGDDRKRRQFTELDDQKSKKGLGDIYADDYVAQKQAAKTQGGASLEEDKETPLVVEARALFEKLTQKLDALSNFHFAPRPMVLEMTIKSDAPALVVEEVGPVMASAGAGKAPEEVFVGGDGKGGTRGSAAGDVKADGELTKDDKKSQRAKRKRKAKAVGNEHERKKVKREKDKEAKEKAAEDAGFTRKAPKVAMLAAAPAGSRSKSEFSKSSKVFSMLQEAKEADALGVSKPKKSDGMKNKASLKL